jgi:O-antigen/teichoic acid export membrane protein
MPQEKKPASAGESFAGSVLKYSVATWLGFGITGAAIVVKGILGPDKTAIPGAFMTATAMLMYLGILGLDQSLLRFYHEPPEGRTGRQLFAACTRFSVGFMAVLGVLCSVFFARPLAHLLGYDSVGPGLIPLLFLNAALYMLVRYLNVLLRLENNIRAYTAETLWMQACYNLFYLLPGFFTSSVWPLVLTAILSFGCVALAFWFKSIERPAQKLAIVHRRGIYRAMVPYGLALAPAQVLIYLNSTLSLSFVALYAGTHAQGVYGFGIQLSQLVTAIQAGFSTYWGPYVYAHYRTDQERIGRVHDILNLLIFGFFGVLVMFEDILFFVFPAYRDCLPVFPLLMLGAVFSILCEGTVYGNSIARRPYHDTIGIAIGAAGNIGLCAVLVPQFGLMGAALALALANGCMFLYRTLFGQYYYRTIPSYTKTLSGFLIAFGITGVGVFCAGNFLLKFTLTGAGVFLLCSLYRTQCAVLLRLARRILSHALHRS